MFMASLLATAGAGSAWLSSARGMLQTKLARGQMRYPVFLPLLLVLVAAVSVLALQRRWIDVPSRLNPWAPLQISATPNFLTRYKLGRLSEDGPRCRAVLATSAMDFEPVADQVTGASCGFHDAVVVRATPSLVGEEFALSCPAAVSLALWERHVVQPAAQRLFGLRVQRFEHFGSYACRNVYGRPEATRSRHATANAWDVAGFVLADGRRIRVASDWHSEGEPAIFLHEVRDGACLFFDGVLSPDYNQAHHDHLHLDRGTFRLCR
jgi:hypothetical protein